MRSPAKQAESEFDDLLGQLTDELAMTPASTSGVALVPNLEPPKVHVESTVALAAEAAAAAGVLQPQVSKPDNTLVKVVAIIAASLTVVSVAALIMFGQAEQPADAGPVEDAAVAQAESEAAEREAAARRAEQQAHELAMQAERAADRAEHARMEAARLAASLAVKPEVASKPKPRTKPKPKPKPAPGDDFDDM